MQNAKMESQHFIILHLPRSSLHVSEQPIDLEHEVKRIMEYIALVVRYKLSMLTLSCIATLITSPLDISPRCPATIIFSRIRL